MILDPSTPLRVGQVLTVWLEPPAGLPGIARDAWLDALKRVAASDRGWSLLASWIQGKWNKQPELKASGVRVVLPPSRKVNGVWVPRKGFEQGRGLFFLVEIAAATQPLQIPLIPLAPTGGSSGGGSSSGAS